jgi:hypothetical protein
VLTDKELVAIWRAAGRGDYATIVRLLILTGHGAKRLAGCCGQKSTQTALYGASELNSWRNANDVVAIAHANNGEAQTDWPEREAAVSGERRRAGLSFIFRVRR